MFALAECYRPQAALYGLTNELSSRIPENLLEAQRQAQNFFIEETVRQAAEGRLELVLLIDADHGAVAINTLMDFFDPEAEITVRVWLFMSPLSFLRNSSMLRYLHPWMMPIIAPITCRNAADVVLTRHCDLLHQRLQFSNSLPFVIVSDDYFSHCLTLTLRADGRPAAFVPAVNESLPLFLLYFVELNCFSPTGPKVAG